MSNPSHEFREAGVLWRHKDGRWHVRRTWPMHVTLEGSFLCLSGAFVGILFSLGIVSFFTHFETVQVGDSTLAHSSTLQRIGAAACMLTMLLPVAVAGLAIVAFGLVINLDGFVPLVIDVP